MGAWQSVDLDPKATSEWSLWKTLPAVADPEMAANVLDFAPGLNVAVRGVQVGVDEITGNKKHALYHKVMLTADTLADVAIAGSVGAGTPEAEVALGIEQVAAKEAAAVAAKELEQVAAKEVPVLVPWKQGGKLITGLQIVDLGANLVDSKLDANKQQVDNLKARLDAVARRDQALIDAAIAKRDADDRKKTPEKEQQRLDGYAALKDAATRRQEDATPAPMTPAPHTDDAPVQVHNKPEVTMDPDLVPDAATPSAVVPQLDLRGPATIVLAGVVLYGAYSAYTLA
jgi:hypothetical protein